ncbi:MAG: DUF2520 domain-containing protein [Dehalococcoidales bacterium]|nr:DUF2520 domain-containing protein [Dehalococcoidales bacterium]MDP7416092.1 DUF2520 domain-containing protein [Dehalococcoidales bacterium]
MLKIGFIGAGTVGTALAIRLSQQGYRVITVHDLKLAAAQRLAQAVKDCRILEKAQGVADTAEFVFITTVDDFIPQVAAKVSWHTGQTVVHCSGAASTEALAPAKEQGARVGCIHPLQTFASITQAVENLPGSTFAIEAEEPTLSVLKELATSLQGSWLELKAEDKALYHASACIACNYFYTLVQIAADLWQNFGVSAAEATRAMMPMLRGSLNNLGNVGLPQALTGPIARGDLVTIRKHRAAFEKKAPAVLSLYKELGNRTIPIGLAKGTLTESRAEELRALFKENQK